MNEPGPSAIKPPKQAKIVKKQLTDDKKKILLNIYRYLERTSPVYPYKMDLYKTTAEIMEVSATLVSRIVKDSENCGSIPQPKKERPTNHCVIKHLDDFTLTAIRRKVHHFYFNGELPTVEKVRAAINEDDMLPSFSKSTMRRILRKLNFSYLKRTRKSILLDRPDLQIWRMNYLQKLADYRKQNKKIYYLDETWLNEGHTCDYVWMDKDIESSKQAFLKGLSTGLKNPQKGKRLIITHIGSEDGFVPGGKWVFEAKKSDGDYHGEMDSHNFERWFKGILEKIEPGSVVVMDNAPYHSRQLERIPNMSWRKDDIQAWLKEKKIKFENSETKAALLLKFDKQKFKAKYVDELAASKGFTVLRLPPYHCELNPIELIWAQVKTYVGRNNKTFKMVEVKRLLEEALTKVGAEKWSNCVRHVLKEEEKMKQIDGISDSAIDAEATTKPFIITVTDDDSMSDSDSVASDRDI